MIMTAQMIRFVKIANVLIPVLNRHVVMEHSVMSRIGKEYAVARLITTVMLVFPAFHVSNTSLTLLYKRY